MQLASIRIITTDVNALVDFYETITGLSAKRYTPDFAELKTETATLAIGSTNTLQFFGGDEVAKAAWNQSAIIEFRVADVDQVFERLQPNLADCLVQAPTMMPWGNKSLLFRDPDGNLVNLFTPASPDTFSQFGKQAAVTG